MRASIIATASLALLLGFTLGAPAQAQNTACFDWECNGGSCSFDGHCSEINDGQPWKFVWDFGDGNTYTGGFTVNHTYDESVFQPTVTLKILLFGSDDYPVTSCTIQVRSNVGPPRIHSGRCSG